MSHDEQIGAVEPEPVDLWTSDARDWTGNEDRLKEVESQLSKQGNPRLKIKDRSRRLRFLVGRHLLQLAWEKEMGMSTMPEIISPQDEKPFWPEVSNPEKLIFNLSYAENRVVCGLSRNHSLGVDAECLERRLSTESVSKVYFDPTEHAALEKLQGHERREAFFCIWTTKEAVLKGLGVGLKGNLKDCRVELVPRGIDLHLNPDIEDTRTPWRVALLSFKTYRTAVALRCRPLSSLDLSMQSVGPDGVQSSDLWSMVAHNGPCQLHARGASANGLA